MPINGQRVGQVEGFILIGGKDSVSSFNYDSYNFNSSCSNKHCYDNASQLKHYQYLRAYFFSK